MLLFSYNELGKLFLKNHYSMIFSRHQRVGVLQPIDGSEESKITIKEGKTDFDMSHLLPLSRWATTAQPVREEFSDSESEDSDSEESTDGLHHPIPRRRKKSLRRSQQLIQS